MRERERENNNNNLRNKDHELRKRERMEIYGKNGGRKRNGLNNNYILT